MARARISAVLITKNEERNIKRCLDTLKWVDEVVVVDGRSTDRTRQIAESFGAKVVEHAFQGDFGMERNIGNENATGDWILALDADEAIPEKTREEIVSILENGSEFDAYNVPRLQYFLGKALIHGGRYHSIVNFFRKGKARFEGKVHHLVLVDGKVGRLERPIEHYPFNSVSEFIHKQDRYTDYEAQELFEKFKEKRLSEVRYNLILKPLKLFFKSYVKKKGFKDGPVGLIFCVLFSWRHFLIWAKYWELCIKKRRETT
jgi:glycosyltransferase involved in cell wall biosynthesis